MEILYLLIAVSVLIVGIIIWAFFWAIRSGQYDDMEGPRHQILMDDETAKSKEGNYKNDNNQ